MLGPLEEAIADDRVPQEARERLRLVAAQRGTPAEAGELAARLLAHRGRADPGFLRADGPARADARSRQHLPLGDGEGRAHLHRGMRGAGGAGLRRSRDVGEDRPQPALERLQVHARRRRGGRDCAQDDGALCSKWPTPAWAFPRQSCRACSSASIASRARGAHARGLGHRPRAGAGAGASCTAAPSRRPASSGKGRAFAWPSRSAALICRRTASERLPRSPATAIGAPAFRAGGAALAARAARRAPPTGCLTGSSILLSSIGASPRRSARASCWPTTTRTCATTCATCCRRTTRSRRWPTASRRARRARRPVPISFSAT